MHCASHCSRHIFAFVGKGKAYTIIRYAKLIERGMTMPGSDQYIRTGVIGLLLFTVGIIVVPGVTLIACVPILIWTIYNFAMGVKKSKDD